MTIPPRRKKKNTPINLPLSFPQEYHATITASEDLYCLNHHSAASNVPPLSKLGSVGTCSRKLVADYGAVAGRTRIKETCADTDCETCVSSLFGSVSKEKIDRDLNVVQTLREAKSPQNLERTADLAVANII